MKSLNMCLRDLTPAELELVAGGTYTCEYPGPSEPYDPWGDSWWYEQMFEDSYEDYGGGGGGGGETGPTDSASNDVMVNFARPLAAAEQAAVDKLIADIARVTNVINAIPDNAAITLSDGSTVAGAELKAIWSAADFVINETGTSYANGTTYGETNYNNGDPVVSYNIDLLQGYNAHPGGIEYVILHEIGQLTANSRAHDAVIHSDGTLTATEQQDHERLANDIARAIANQGGMTILANPAHGYSATIPVFTTPTSGGNTGGGTSGGGYYTYDLPFHYADYYWNRYQIP